MFQSITAEDIPAIVDLMNRAYRGTGSTASWNTEADFIAGDRTTADLLRQELLAKPDASFLKWIETPDAAPIGCVLLQPETEETWYLGSLAADPDRQGGGLGRELLLGAEDWVRHHGGTRVRMTVVNVRDTLIAWYLRRGYRLTGATEPFPYSDHRFGTPLRADLCFVVLEKLLA